jgi:hypothetical protein
MTTHRKDYARSKQRSYRLGPPPAGNASVCLRGVSKLAFSVTSKGADDDAGALLDTRRERSAPDQVGQK